MHHQIVHALQKYLLNPSIKLVFAIWGGSSTPTLHHLRPSTSPFLDRRVSTGENGVTVLVLANKFCQLIC